MPSEGNSDSMPKVRASSGTIGTQRLPVVLSRIRSFISRTNAMVVAMDWLPEPLSNAANDLSAGAGSGAIAWLRRAGAGPPSAARRSWR